MDPERRTALEERRKFLQQRNEARAFRALLEPAWTGLEEAGEHFRVYRPGSEPSWSPDWIPAGYSYIPWRELSGVRYSEPLEDLPAMALAVRALLATRLGAEASLLLVASGWSVELPRAAFDRHAESLLDAAWQDAYLVAPPAQWLICADRSQVIWKDG